ncbi:hypothetical protein LCGC14_1954210 [marine sediment metagenome]|uniref:Uncharacterized protein n=1 Tax=marine sediment metagenome TaxID=412755 RepID=A0A0F9G4W4_9ZZZZ
MSHQTMPKPKSVEPVSMLLLPSPALLLAEGIAEAEAKAPRLRAQQRGRVATRKKGRFRAALRHLWDKKRPFKAYINGIEIGGPSGGPHNSSEIHPSAPARRPEHKGESGDTVRPLPPEEKKG